MIFNGLENYMSKSILVIDTSRDCSKCDLKDGYFCGKTKRWIDEDDFPKPDWCPLRDLPKKMVEETRWFDKEYAVGYNSCIDEILKQN